MNIKNIFASIAVVFSLSGCTFLYDTFVYQIDITQGNYTDADKLSQVRTGMSQAQVIYVLGSPMLIDQFDSSKWYYIRYIKPGGEPVEQSETVLTFENKILVSIQSSNVNSENPLVKQASEAKSPNQATETGDDGTTGIRPSSQ